MGPKITIIHLHSERKDGKEPCSDNRPNPNENRRMMLSPEYWPIWPILALKNTNRPAGRPPRLGVLYDKDGDEDGKGPPRFGFLERRFTQISNADLKGSPDADIDQLLIDGWIVD